MTILVACGLQREARIIKGTGVIPVTGGGIAADLENRLEDTITEYAREGHKFSAILSSGIAGALDPALKAGDVVIGDLHPDTDHPAPFPGEGRGPVVGAAGLDPGLRRGSALLERVLQHLPRAHHGTIIGQDHIAATTAEKAALAATGALAVDMESHVAARVAARHGLPFVAIRTISDTAHETLPPAALLGMNPDGSMALGKVLSSLARRPGQLPALIRTGRSAELAFKSLARVHAALGPVWATLLD